jgi:hypothetical protein
MVLYSLLGGQVESVRGREGDGRESRDRSLRSSSFDGLKKVRAVIVADADLTS